MTHYIYIAICHMTVDITLFRIIGTLEILVCTTLMSSQAKYVP